MAATLSVYFKAIDQISSKLTAIADSGNKLTEKLDEMRNNANDAFDRMYQGSGKVKEAMADSANAASRYATSISDAGRATGEAHTNVEQLAAKANEAQNALENEANAANTASQGLESFTASETAAQSSAEALAGKGQVVEDSMKQQASAAQEAGKEVDKYGDEAQKAGDKSEEFGEKGSQAAVSLSEAIAAAGIAKMLSEIKDAFVESTEAAEVFETSMAKLSTIADETEVSIGEMQADIMALSQKTGKSVNDLAESAYQAISASVDTADAVAFVAQANRLAAGGFTEAATAVDVLTTTINAYNMEAEDATMIADRLVNTQNLGKTTVGELAASMGTVIPTAAAFSVSLDNLATGYVTLTRNGINTANATTMLNGMFSELADSGSDVADILFQKTGKSFTQLMEDGYTLGDVIQVLGDYVDGDSTAFVNLWGNIRAGRGAVNIFNAGATEFNKVMGQMADSAGAADEAYKKMADTSAVVDKKFRNASENLKIAVGDQLMPIFDELKSKGTDILNLAIDYVNENPEVVDAVLAGVTALTTFVGVVGTVAIAAKLGAAAMSLLTASMAVNPIFLAITAVGALAVGLGVLAATTKDTTDYTEEYTVKSQEMANKLDEQRQKVEDLEQRYGQYDERVIAAKVDLEAMEEEFAATGQTIGQLNQKMEESVNAWEEAKQSYQETTTHIDDTGTHALMLIEKLERLRTVTEKTPEQLTAMQQMLSDIRSMYPEMEAYYDEVTGYFTMSAGAMRNYVKAQQEAAKEQAKYDDYVKTLELIGTMEEQRAEQLEVVNQKQAEYNELAAQDDYEHRMLNADNWVEEFEKAGYALDDAKEKLAGFDEKLDEAKTHAEEYESAHGLLEEQLNNVADATDNAAQKQDELGQNMSAVFNMCQEEANQLVDTYNKVSEAITSAVEGSFGMFEKVEQKEGEAKQTAEDFLEALKSQEEYFNRYNENLQKAQDKQYGLDPEIVQRLADGTQTSANQLDTIIEKIDQLGPGTKEAKEYVDQLNESFHNVEDSKETLEQTLIDMNQVLKDQTEELENKMKTCVENLNLDEESAASANATMDAYISALRTKGAEAEQAAQQTVNNIKAIYASAPTAPTVSGKPDNSAPSNTSTYASGTTYSDRVFIAGEKGAELFIDKEGSEIFPASETAKILQAIYSQGKLGNLPAPPAGVSAEQTTITTNSNSRQKLDININGKGVVGVQPGISMEKVENYVVENIRPVLLQILSQEAMEEGDAVYEF